ncbi:MAG: hypothetical protein H6730_27880 [Deltaproteobacteria bacterium]|nr:hypothetical protein [Deltaproteobacteria bacterium]
MSLLTLAYLLLPAVGALLANQATDVRTARRVGAGFLAAATLIASTAPVSLLLAADDPLWALSKVASRDPALAWAPAFVSLVSFVAVAMTPAVGTRPASIARMMAVAAAAGGVVAMPHPAVVAIAWALGAVPVWLELRRASERGASARMFALYMLPSAGLVASGCFLLSDGGTLTGFVVLTVGLAIREAVMPLHSWLLAAVDDAPMGLVVAFVAPQIGVAVHLSQNDILPSAGVGEAMAIISALTAVGAAFMGVFQSNARRAVAYLFISQSGLVGVGLETSSEVARTGATLTWMTVGLASAGFAMALAALEARRGRQSLERPAGSLAETPRLAAAFLVLGLASVGLPATVGFVAEDLLMQGTVGQFPSLGLMMVAATALNGVTVVKAFFALFNGTPARNPKQDLLGRERLVLSLVLACLVGLGLAPALATRAAGPSHAATRSE